MAKPLKVRRIAVKIPTILREKRSMQPTALLKNIVDRKKFPKGFERASTKGKRLKPVLPKAANPELFNRLHLLRKIIEGKFKSREAYDVKFRLKTDGTSYYLEIRSWNKPLQLLITDQKIIKALDYISGK
ncbi:MAG: hypothetical protein Q7S21_06815 [archaeon]|nr:hypothetical protein [archaeon]